MIQILEGHLDNTKKKLGCLTSDREVKVDSGCDMSSSSFHDDDARVPPDGETSTTPTTAGREMIPNSRHNTSTESIPATPDQPLKASKRATSDLVNYRIFRRRPNKGNHDVNAFGRQHSLRSYPTQKLDCLRDEIDADLAHAHMLSTSLRTSISNDLQKSTTDNSWFYESMKSRQDVVGSVARSYDLEDNSDTYSYVSSYIPCKIPTRNHKTSVTNISCDSLSTTLANDKLYPAHAQDGDADKSYDMLTVPCPDSSKLSRKGIPCNLHFSRYLVSEVDSIQKSYYL